MRNLNGKNEQKQAGFVLIFLALAIAVLLVIRASIAIVATRNKFIYNKERARASSARGCTSVRQGRFRGSSAGWMNNCCTDSEKALDG